MGVINICYFRNDFKGSWEFHNPATPNDDFIVPEGGEHIGAMWLNWDVSNQDIIASFKGTDWAGVVTTGFVQAFGLCQRYSNVFVLYWGTDKQNKYEVTLNGDTDVYMYVTKGDELVLSFIREPIIGSYSTKLDVVSRISHLWDGQPDNSDSDSDSSHDGTIGAGAIESHKFNLKEIESSGSIAAEFRRCGLDLCTDEHFHV